VQQFPYTPDQHGDGTQARKRRSDDARKQSSAVLVFVSDVLLQEVFHLPRFATLGLQTLAQIFLRILENAKRFARDCVLSTHVGNVSRVFVNAVLEARNPVFVR
jgi:hypothetical protein